MRTWVRIVRGFGLIVSFLIVLSPPLLLGLGLAAGIAAVTAPWSLWCFVGIALDGTLMYVAAFHYYPALYQRLVEIEEEDGE